MVIDALAIAVKDRAYRKPQSGISMVSPTLTTPVERISQRSPPRPINALMIWGVPKSWVNQMKLTATGLLGYWLSHPRERTGTFYGAIQLGATFGAR